MWGSFGYSGIWDGYSGIRGRKYDPSGYRDIGGGNCDPIQLVTGVLGQEL